MILHCPEKGCQQIFSRGRSVNGITIRKDSEIRNALQHHLWLSHSIPAEEAWAKVNAIAPPAGSREVAR